MNKKKILIIPNQNKDNKYIDLMKMSFCEAGFIETPYIRADYISINWYEGVNTKNYFRAWLSFLKKIFFIFGSKIIGKKIIWTFHNKYPHNNRYPKLALFLERMIVLNSKYIIIHSKSSKLFLLIKHPKAKTKNIIFLPHPNYINSYPKEDIKRKELVETEKIIFLFIGMIDEYKGVNHLINTFNLIDSTAAILRVYGKVSASYKTVLENTLKSSNIELHFGFVDDSNISRIIAESDIIVTPYLPDTMLNSGTHILGFSYGKTVLTTPTCTDLDIDSKLWFRIDESQSMEDSILYSVKNIIKNYSKGDLNYMGTQLLNLMQRDYSIGKIANMIAKTIK